MVKRAEERIIKRLFYGLCGLFLLFLLPGCGEEGGLSVPLADANVDSIGQNPGDTWEDQNPDNLWVHFSDLFIACSEQITCMDERDICLNGVCVRSPMEEARLWADLEEQYVEMEESPDLSCWDEPWQIAANEPGLAVMKGPVELFGPASPTTDLCVTQYDEPLFLRWFTWMEDHLCGELRVLDERYFEPYINCFSLDPCRCNDAAFTEYRGSAADSVEACYAEIGFCTALEDSPELLSQCRENILERTGLEADTLIYGSSVSIPFPDDPSRIEGQYEIEDIPTNRPLVSKVSGTMSRWRDTYEFGVFLRADHVLEGEIEWATNVITDGAWETIPQSSGVAYPIAADGTAIAGIVRDCGGEERGPEPVEHVTAGFLNEPVATAYFNGVWEDLLPLPGRADTNKDGVYVAIDLRPGPNRVSLAAQREGEIVSAGVRDLVIPPYSVAICTFEGSWQEWTE